MTDTPYSNEVNATPTPYPWDFTIIPIWYTTCLDYPDFVGSVCPVAALGPPVLLTATPSDGQVSLTWTSVTNATGYKLRYGRTTGVYANVVDVGNVTAHTITSLPNGVYHYFVAFAYNATLQSVNSNELSAIYNTYDTTPSFTGDRPQWKGRQRVCVVCGHWYPQRDFRMRENDGQFVCKWDIDKNDSKKYIKVEMRPPRLKGQMRECCICGFWYPERDFRIRTRLGKYFCKWDYDFLTHYGGKQEEFLRVKSYLKQEAGDYIFLETGDRIELETNP